MRKAAGETRGPAAGPGKIPSFAEPEPHPWDNLVSASPEAAPKDFPVRNVYYVLLTASKVTWCQFHRILFSRRVTGSCRLWKSYLR